MRARPLGTGIKLSTPATVAPTLAPRSSPLTGVSAFAPGRNVVFWDGRDADGQVVPSGIYVVAVRFDGQTQVASIAVANR